jgi:hypothetical protein
MNPMNWLRSVVSKSRSQTRCGLRPRQIGVESLETRTLLDATAIASELLLNTQTDNVQQFDAHVNQTVAGLPGGGFVAVWQSQRQDGSGWEIFAQRFDAAGAKVGTEFQVNQSTRYNQRGATVAAASDGRFVVTWQSFGQDGSSTGVIARTFNAVGTATGNEFSVNQSTRGIQGDADVAFLNGGNIAFTWSGRAAGDKQGVVVRVFNSTGNAVTDEVPVNQFTKGRQQDPAIAADASGGFWITWSGRGSGDRNGIFARRFGATGTPLAGQFLVNSVTKRAQEKPAVAASDDGRVLIAWQSRRQDGSGLGVFAQLYNQDGTAQGTAFQVNQTTRRHQHRPAVDFTSDGGFAVAWMGVGSGDRQGIYVREYNRDATPESAERLVNQTTQGPQTRPGLSRLTNGFVVSWSGRGNGDRRGVFASLFQETPVTTTFTLAPIADQPVPELQTFTTTAAVVGTQSGVQFSLTGDVPAGATINPTTGQFTWTPTEAQGPGTFDFKVRASVGQVNDDETFRLTVTEVNQAPVLAAIGNRTASPGTTVSFTAIATDADSPANTVSYSLGSGAPVGAAINSSSGVLTWTIPPSTPVGNVSLTVQATDNGSPALSDSETLTVFVVSNPATPVLTTIADVTVDEGATVSFTVQATDADLPNDRLTYSLGTGAPTGAAINPDTGVFTWLTSEANGPGTRDVTVIVTDGGGRSDQQTVQITVREVNQAPVLAAIGNRTAAAGSVASFTASATDPDSPANSLTYRLGTGAPAGASINSSTGVFSWNIPPETVAGNVSVTVLATDNGTPALSDSETFSISVTAAPLPGVSINDVTVNEGAGNAVVTLSLSAATSVAASVSASTSPGSATVGADYTTTTSTISVCSRRNSKDVYDSFAE